MDQGGYSSSPGVAARARGGRPGVLFLRFVAVATADAIGRIATAIQQPGGEQAVQLKVAEKAVEAYAQLAQKNNTMIVPGNMSEVAGLIGTAMGLLKGGNRA